MNSPLKAWVRALEATAPIERGEAPCLPVLVERLAARFGAAPALVSRNGTLSYRSLAASVHQYARWALARGFDRGDVVALLMGNCPAYMAIWLGLSRVGVTVALINTNLTGELLARAIEVAKPRALILGQDSVEQAIQARTYWQEPLPLWVYGPSSRPLPRIDREAEAQSDAPLSDSDCPAPRLSDRALYIYTSGTTGLPKAAHVSHFRIMQWAHWFAGLMDTQPHDRMYNCLPMYHSIGGVVATGAVLVAGGAVIVRERFSASEFWRDLVSEDCTLFQYIGELCRYLLHSPSVPEERRHRLRLCCGNGLRADVWEAFRDRFQIPQILEYYAATEGSFSLYNCEGRVGSIGRIPPFLRHRMPVELVKFDAQVNLPSRNARGRCERVEDDEVGEAIGQIVKGGLDHGGRFEGYADPEASNAKVMRDVFESGDAWYRTGDLMRRDQQGFFYFVDRVGDTFRWKGENVSTTEVEAVIASCPGVRSVAVYGVTVPGTDGRAGMAALVIDPHLTLQTLRAHIHERIPAYARPIFLRITASIELTGTLRPRKAELAAAGYDPMATTDELYIDDQAAHQYRRLDAELLQGIRAGRWRA